MWELSPSVRCVVPSEGKGTGNWTLQWKLLQTTCIKPPLPNFTAESINTPEPQWSPGVCGFPFQSWGPCAQSQLREPLSDVSFRKSVMAPTSVTNRTSLHHAGIVSFNATTVRDPERARTHSRNLLRLSRRCTASFREGPHSHNLLRQCRRDFLKFTPEFCAIGKYAKWR